MPPPTLLAVPNVSEGRDAALIAQIGQAFAHEGARLLDTHSDPDHHRSVYTLAGEPGCLSEALLNGARAVTEAIDLSTRDPADLESTGQHPYVGALDVVPLVYLDDAQRGAACAEALLTVERLAQELDLPVFLYGALAGGRTRAELRRGGLPALTERMATADLRPDFGPSKPHPTAGATLVAARPPLVAFNLQLAPPATLADAKRIAARIRETGPQGIPGLRAIGLELSSNNTTAQPTPQVSMNVENPLDTPLAQIIDAVRALAPIQSAELVGLAPRAALAGFPQDIPMPGFDPARHVIENRLGSS
jgi:glutamate formiminotransferase / 5-formyltetrahydrofolate cyclo-ligase